MSAIGSNLSVYNASSAYLSSGAAAWSPNSMSAPVAWWQPDDSSTITQSSGLLDNMADKIGSYDMGMTDTDQENRPFINTVTLNGLAVVDCRTVTTTRFLSLGGTKTAGAYSGITELADRRGAIFGVINSAVLSNGAIYGLRNALGADLISSRWTNGRGYLPSATNGYLTQNPYEVLENTWHIFAAIFSDTAQEFYLDSVLIASSAAGDAATAFDAFTMGIRPANSLAGQCYIGETFINGDPVNTATRLNAEGYLADRYGLA